MSRPLPTLAARLLCCCGFSFRRSLGKIERMLGDPLCSAALLAGVIASDPMLSARILSRANAALAEDHDPVLHLTAAIQALGLAVVHGLVLETRAIPPEQSRTMASCWAAANATASMARILRGYCRASVRQVLDEEALFCGGLLHDLGTALAHRFWEEECRSAALLVESRGCDFATALRATLGLDPGSLGMLLATSWQLPEQIGRCMRHHDHPERAEEDRELLGVIHIARQLVRACGFTTPGDPYVVPIDPPTLDLLGLRITDLEAAVRNFFDELDEHEIYEGVLAPASG